MYSAPKTLFVNLVYEGVPAPYNSNWLGTSDLAKLLVEKGYRVYTSDTWDKLMGLIDESNSSRIIVVFISPEYSIKNGEALELFERFSRKNISLLIADENTTSNKLLNLFNTSITGKTLTGPNGSIYVPALMCVPSGGNARNYSLILSIASYIIYRGNIQPIIFMGNYTGIPVNLYNTTPIKAECTSYSYNDRIVGLFSDIENGRYPSRIAVFSDGTIFLNTALRHSTKEMNYTDFALNVIDALSFHENPGNVTIVFDLSHYPTNLPNVNSTQTNSELLENYFKAPLPIILHPAVIAYLFLLLLKNSEEIFLTHLSDTPIIAIPIVAVLAYVSHRILKSGIYWETIRDDVEIDVIEKSVLDQSMIRAELLSKKKMPRRKAIEALYNLYLLVDNIFKDHLGYSIEELLEDDHKMEATSKILGIDKLFLTKYLSRLVKYRDKFVSKKITPLLLRWNFELERRISETENILEKMGYTLKGEISGLRGVEYGIRKY